MKYQAEVTLIKIVEIDMYKPMPENWYSSSIEQAAWFDEAANKVYEQLSACEPFDFVDVDYL